MQHRLTEVMWSSLNAPICLHPGVDNVLRVIKQRVPIIFVPGIMGSRLRQRRAPKKVVWDCQSLRELAWSFALENVEPWARRTALLGDAGFATDFLETFGTPDDDQRRQSWSMVSRFLYGPLHAVFDQALAQRPLDLIMATPSYAFAYNWTCALQHSAEQLAFFIEHVMGQEAVLGPCDDVILVTHSLGGLIARAACRLFGQQKRVLAMMHVAQPTCGAPALYWRLKAGFEHETGTGLSAHAQALAAAWLLGNDGRKTTTLISGMPGAMALLPTAHYVDVGLEPGWLKIVDQDMQTLDALPKAADPVREIYQHDRPLAGTMPNDTLGLIKDRARIVKKDGATALVQAEEFHRRLGLWAHPNSFCVAGTGIKTVDSTRFVVRKHPRSNDQTPSQADSEWFRSDHKSLTPFYGLGKFRAGRRENDGTISEHVDLMAADADGDGTVSVSNATRLHDATPNANDRLLRVKNLAHDQAMLSCMVQKFLVKKIGEQCAQKAYLRLRR